MLAIFPFSTYSYPDELVTIESQINLGQNGCSIF
jgi:hypothetical protein